MTPEISIIIPTINKPGYLKECLVSVLNQDEPDRYEIIVVDNRPGGIIEKVVEGLNKSFGHRIKYCAEPQIGLHNARHSGARAARADILAYIDDDVIVDKKWFRASELFKDSKIHMIGGKILPRWEADPPSWLEAFWCNREFGKLLGYLSLLDFGEELKQISPLFVWGCNMMIRKNTLYDCGGFHPDGFSQEYIKYRGDGETGLAYKFVRKGYNAFYNPVAKVEHMINKERLTVKYFCQRAYNQGISDSFTEIRKNGGIKASYLHRLKQILKNMIKRIYVSMRYFSNKDDISVIKMLVGINYEKGRLYHANEVLKDPALLNYVLKESWLNKNEL